MLHREIVDENRISRSISILRHIGIGQDKLPMKII